jgi:ectoine hydroxylase-related dioxygenase (phytanoyl-CoA dioxygenase family)/AcrR family transcriptional regulator
VVSALAKDGYAIVENLLTADQLAALWRELGPHLDARPPGKDNMMGVRTRRFGRLLARSSTVQALLIHPLVLSAADAVLLPYCVRYHINYTGVMFLEPGETKQPLHRDTGFYPFQNPAPPLLLSTLWAVSDFTAGNGATCLVPGSRHWNDTREPKPEEIVAAEMPAGSVLLYLGSTFHGGGANRSNEARFGLALHYALGWLRQEENQYLAVPIEEARKLPRKIQELMGYAMGGSALGFVDHQDPNEFLNGRPSLLRRRARFGIGPQQHLQMRQALPSRGERSRRRILETAQRVLEEEGLERFILREIAKRAEMGLGNLQYYFPTRDDLLTAVIRSEFERNLRRIRRLDDDSSDLGAHLERFSRLLIGEYTSPGGKIWAVLALLRLHNGRFRRLSEEIYHEHYDTLADAMRSFGVAGTTDELRERARLITAVLDGAALQAHAGPHSRDSHSWRSFCQKIGEVVVAVAKR